jgi:hypothetical protein
MNWTVELPEGTSAKTYEKIIQDYVTAYCNFLNASGTYTDCIATAECVPISVSGRKCAAKVDLSYCIECKRQDVFAEIEPDDPAQPNPIPALSRNSSGGGDGNGGGVAAMSALTGSIQSMQTGPTPPPPPKPSV